MAWATRIDEWLGRRSGWSRLRTGFLLTVMLAGVARGEFAVETWRSDAGLPNETVTSITQTTDGFLWVGTMNGLARFDGVKFEVFDGANTPVLGSARISQVERRHAGGLWVSTMEGKLVRMENGCFFPEPEATVRGGEPGAEILTEGPGGRLWLTIRDGRLACWEGGKLTMVSDAWQARPGAHLQARLSPDGELLVNGGLANGAGICRWKDGTLSPLGQGFNPAWEYHAPGRDGAVWIDDGTSVRLWRDGQWLTPAAPVEWRDHGLSFGIEARDGGLWLSTRGLGVLHYGRDGTVTRVGRSSGMGGEFVTCLFEDQAGSIWAALEGGGLSRIRPALFTMAATAAAAPGARVTALSPAADGDGMWAGTDGDGVLRIHGDGTVERESKAGPLQYADVTALIEVSAGQLLVGTLRNGWMRVGETEIGVLQGFADASVPVRALFKDSKGRIWAGQRTANRLICLSPGSGEGGGAGGRIFELPNTEAVADVRCFAEDPGGSIWIGCDAGGLYRMESGGKSTHYTTADGLAGDNVWALLADADGTLWIGHAGGGLTRWKDGVFTVCGAARGFPDEVVCGLLDDGAGGLWINGGSGIFRLSMAELNACCDGVTPVLRPIRFGPGDGLPGDQKAGGIRGGTARTPDGRLWFATTRGVVMALPTAYQPDPQPPQVVMDRLRVDGREVPSAGTEIELGPETRYFEFHYAGLSLSHPSLVVFQCRLAGVDDHWQDVGFERWQSYSALPPGKYLFQVRARTRDHVWSVGDASLAFRIRPPWWRVPWVLAVLGTAAGGLLVGGTRMIVTRRAARRAEKWRQRHALEVERGRIARDIHDQMGAGLTEIALLGDFLRLRAEGGEEAAEVASRARELARTMDETVWAINPAHDSLDGLVSYLAHALPTWLKHTGIRHRLELPEQADHRILTGERRNSLYLACKETVHNAVKHAQAGEIRLAVRTLPERLEIEIADDGRGFDPEMVGSRGNGLANVRHRLAEIGGSVMLRSAAGEGTAVTLSVPLSEVPLR